jgi:RNA polymerase sigma-70 factor (ECF subfamily)
MEPVKIDALLADRDWVRRLARSLARDDAQADDLAQDGWVSALRSPPARAVRAWWRRVLRRRAMELRREEDRRTAREERRAQPTPVGAELLERLELEQAVAQAVRDLPGHYRDVVLLRYFEEMPPRAIAKRLAVPVETVRTRLKRAHELLRERLGEARRDWRAGMLLVAWPGSLLGGIAVETKKVAAGALALCLLLLSVGLLVWRGSGGSDDPGRAAGARSTAASTAAEATEIAAEEPAATEPRGAVLGTIAGPLPVLDGVAPLAIVRVLRGGTEVAAGRFPPGPFRVAYDRVDGCVAEIRAPGTRTQTFALPSAMADLGEIRFYQALLYGGRLLDLQGDPVRHAIVYFRNAQGGGASEPTGDDGKFRIDLDGMTNVCLDPKGNLSGDLLDVQVKDGWLGPYYASPAGFQGRHDIRMDLAEVEPDPVVRIVSNGEPVPGRRVAIHLTNRPRPSLPDPFATAVTGDDGCAQLAWPPQIRFALLTIEDAKGTVHASLLRDEIEHPVHEIDLGRLARIAVAFMRPGGQPAEGARVWLGGTWRPDAPGKPVNSPRAQAPGYEPGAVTALLYGTVPADGIMRWSFPVERPGEGAFFTEGWVAACPGDMREHGRDDLYGPPYREGEAPYRIVLEERPDEIPSVRTRFRDSQGPVVPQNLGLRLLRQGRLTHVEGVLLRETADGSVEFRLPDPADFDVAELYVTVAGRPPATVTLTQVRLREAIRDRSELCIDLPEGKNATFRVARPNGEPARNVLVTLVPEGADHISAGIQRLQSITDDAGGVVMGGCEDIAYAVVAFDLATGEGVRLDGFRAEGILRDIVLKVPRRTRVRIIFPDGAPAPKALVDVETRPRYLAPVLFAVADQDGWAELPRAVPGVFVLDIKACDRRLTRKDLEGWPALPFPITHSAVVPMASVDDGGTITVPMRDDVARWDAETK